MRISSAVLLTSCVPFSVHPLSSAPYQVRHWLFHSFGKLNCMSIIPDQFVIWKVFPLLDCRFPIPLCHSKYLHSVDCTLGIHCYSSDVPHVWRTGPQEEDKDHSCHFCTIGIICVSDSTDCCHINKRILSLSFPTIDVSTS